MKRKNLDEKLPITPWQQVVLETYDDGDFDFVSTRRQIENAGDGLFRFLMLELAAEEDCEDFNDAIHRVKSAIADLEKVLTALEFEAEAKGMADGVHE